MNQRKKNARPSVAAPGQAVETGTPSKMASTSTTNDTTFGGGGQWFRVEDFLEFGVESARTLRYLKSILHQDGRTIRSAIEAARKDGIPIVSGQDGYWLTTDPAEIKRFSRSMKRRAAQIRLTALHVERAVRNNGQ